jgi:hypothetical protein
MQIAVNSGQLQRTWHNILIETMNSISASFVTRIDNFTSEATAASKALGRGTFLANGATREKICHLASETYHVNQIFECNLFDLFILLRSPKSFECRLSSFLGTCFIL